MGDIKLEDVVPSLRSKNSPEEEVLEYLNLIDELDTVGEHIDWLVNEASLLAALVRVVQRRKKQKAVMVLAMKCLYKVASEDKYLNSAAEVDVPGNVILLLQQSLQDEDILGYGLLLLGNMGTNPHVKQLIHLQRGIEVIVEIMQCNANNCSILEKSCYALANLSIDSNENVQSIIASGGALTTIDAIKTFMHDANMIESASSLIANLCSDATARPVLANFNAIPIIIQAIHVQQNNPDMVASLLRSLGNLALCSDNVTAFLDHNIVEVLSDAEVLQQHRQNQVVVELCLAALANVASEGSPEQVVCLIRGGILKTCILTGKWYPSVLSLQMTVFTLLGNVLRSNTEIPDSQRRPLINCVLNTMRSIDWDEQLISMAMHILMKMSADENMCSKMVQQSQTIPTLLDFLKSFANSTEIFRLNLNLLGQLTNEGTSAYIFSSTKLLDDILNALHSNLDNDVNAASCIIVLIKLGSFDEDASAAVAEKATTFIIQASEANISSPTLIQIVSAYFANISTHKSAIGYILNPEVFKLLTELVTTYESNPDMLIRLILALNNLVLADVDADNVSKKMIQDLNLISKLLDIREKNSDSTQLVQMIDAFCHRLNFVDNPAEFKAVESKPRKKWDMNVPELEEGAKIFLQQGSIVQKHGSSNSNTRHLFVSVDLRFICWRDPSVSTSVPHRIPVLSVEDIIQGRCTPSLQRTSFWGNKPIVEDDSVVFGVLCKGQKPLSIECRDKQQCLTWVNNLKALVAFRRDVQALKSDAAALNVV